MGGMKEGGRHDGGMYQLTTENEGMLGTRHRFENGVIGIDWLFVVGYLRRRVRTMERRLVESHHLPRRGEHAVDTTDANVCGWYETSPCGASTARAPTMALCSLTSASSRPSCPESRERDNGSSTPASIDPRRLMVDPCDSSGKHFRD